MKLIRPIALLIACLMPALITELTGFSAYTWVAAAVAAKVEQQ
jgi:hypothetical protein